MLILQDALNALGYSTKTLDGAFGKNTYDALRAAQRSFSLTADGVCGCNTWKKADLRRGGHRPHENRD